MGFGDTSKKDKDKAKAAASAEASKKAAEDASWKDGDKGAKSKEDRAAAKAAQADAKLEAKKERQALEAAEEASTSSMKGANKKASGSTKVTQAEIQRRQALMAMAAAAKAPAKSKKTEVVAQPKIEANTNRDNGVEASGIDAALSALDTGSEKKAGKMTYKEFEASVLPQIQEENPGLKMSQAKDKAFKMWERSPDNPKNQEK